MSKQASFMSTNKIQSPLKETEEIKEEEESPTGAMKTPEMKEELDAGSAVEGSVAILLEDGVLSSQ